VVERHGDRWLAGIVAELRSAARSDDLGRLIVEAACRVAECEHACLTLPHSEGGEVRGWHHPQGADPDSPAARTRHVTRIQIGDGAFGELSLLRSGGEPFTPRQVDRAELVGQLGGALLGRVIALEERSAAERQFRVLVEQLPLAIYIDALDDGATSMYNNPANELITGCSDDEWKADPNLFSKILHRDDRDRVLGLFAQARANHQPVSAEYRIVRPDGSQVWVRDEAVVVHDEEGNPQHIQGYLLDITRRRMAEDELARLAFEDAVTGLPNRRSFDERLEGELVAHASRGDSFAVVFIDLDNFKLINDAYGHDAGDLLLRTAAVSLSAQLRDADFLARLGGDEFVALISRLPADRVDATRVATEIVERLLSAAGQDLVEGGKRVSVSASVGLALFPHDARGGGSLLRLADTSMYRAKQAGRNRFQLAG
jgi:diguanylate cyclase (GGDEF)-like protein/PAS domain S-box-containing protein